MNPLSPFLVVIRAFVYEACRAYFDARFSYQERMAVWIKEAPDDESRRITAELDAAIGVRSQER